MAGSHELIRDAVDDMMLPTIGVRNTQRYADAMTAMTPGITHVVGHSLGASVAKAIATDNPRLQARLYGAPSVTWSNSNPRIQSYRRIADPISLFDRAAHHSVPPGWNTHSYKGFG